MPYTAPEDVANSTQDQHDLAAEAIDAYCRRSFGQKNEFVMDGPGTDTIYLPLPVLGISAIFVDGVSVPTVNVVFENKGNRLVRMDGDWTEGKLNVTVRGTFGYNPVPLLVVEASKRLVQSMVDGSWQPGSFGAVKVGSVSYETGGPEEANIIGDPTIEALLDPLRRKVRAFSE